MQKPNLSTTGTPAGAISGATTGAAGKSHALAELKWQPIVTDLLDSLNPHQRMILGLLAISDHLDSNPAPLLKNLGCELFGKLGFDLIKMADSLTAGNDLFKTMEQYPKLVPPQVVVLLRLAQQDGMLKWVFACIRQRFPRFGRTREIGIHSGLALYIKVWVVVSVITFLLLKIVPEFSKIFVEFNVPSEKLSLAVAFLDSFGWALRLTLLLLGLFGLGWFISRIFWIIFGGRPWQRRPAPRIVTRNRFLGSLAQTGSVANIIERFATSTSLKRLLPRLNSVRNRMLQGRDVWSALADKRLVSRSDANRVSLVSPETQAWLLRSKAAKQERRFEMNWIIGGRVVWVLVQMVLVCVVLLACLTVFGALIDMLNLLLKF